MGPDQSTIFARASGAGKAGVAVWRVSGPDAFALAAALCRKAPPKGRRAALRDLFDRDGAKIDRGLVLLFKGPCSFTGEDVAEFHVHGSRAVERALADALAAAGARAAEAGEFTRRALRNGKLDLAQVEALGDLLDAETEAQRRQALGQLDGRLSALAEGWRRRLIAILAPLEADIDFPDEEGVPAAVAARAGPEIEVLLQELRAYARDSDRIRTIRDGVKVAIIGAPNAGKSTLLNRLAGSDLAIVSGLPGTTRDVIEARLDLAGLPVLLADTAGLREAEDAIEAEGIRRTRHRADAADLRVLVVDALTLGQQSPTGMAEGLLRDGDLVVVNKVDVGGGVLGGSPPGPPFSRGGTRDGLAAIPPLEKGGLGGDPPRTPYSRDMAARNVSSGPSAAKESVADPPLAPPFQGGEDSRHDLSPIPPLEKGGQGGDQPQAPLPPIFPLSAQTGEGVDIFIRALTDAVRDRFSAAAETGLSRRRHVEAVSRAMERLESAHSRIETAPELAAEDVRLAARALGEITGAVDVEAVLAEIFSSFCIGK